MLSGSGQRRTCARVRILQRIRTSVLRIGRRAVVLLVLLPSFAQAAEQRDLPAEVDELTEGMNAEQLESVRILIHEKIETARSGQPQSGSVASSAPGTTTDKKTGKRLSLEIGQKFFFYNLEGSTYSVRNARTLFGDVVDAKLRYRIGRSANIRAGAVAILPFAEDNFDLRWGDYYRDYQPGDHSNLKVNLLQPFLQLSVDYENFRFNFGDLETPHDYHLLVEYDVYEFLRPAEKGLQIFFKSENFYQDLYVNWREKNTPGNHERFNLGSISKLSWAGGSLALQLLYVHRGGVEYSQDPVVFENIAAALVLDHSYPVDNAIIDRAGIEIVPLFTNDLAPVPGSQQSRTNGFGALGSIYVTSGHWRLNAGYWAGSDKVYAEEGLPFSRQERFVYTQLLFGKKLKYNIEVQIKLAAGVFGKDLDSGFIDQKLVVTWRHDFGLGR